MDNTIKISRQELYDLVWSKPLIHLAKEFNLSDVGLAKICRRHNIPLPSMGHWAKLAHGYNVKKTPLPVLNKGEVDQIELILKEPSPFNELHSEDTKEDQIDKAIGHSFVILNEFKKGFHPLILDAQKELRERLKSYRKLEECERIHFLNMSVTNSSTERALSLMNMLFQIIEANGLPIIRKPGYKEETYVKVNGVDVQVALKERMMRSENPDSKSYNKYVFHPTGILYFEFVNIYVSGARKIWNDTPTTKLEEIVNDVVLGIVVAAILDKKIDEEREKSRKAEEEERDREQLIEQQKKEEEERVHALFRDAQKWQISNIVRGYLRAVEEKYASVTLTVEEKRKLACWITWAKNAADLNDPLVDHSLEE